MKYFSPLLGQPVLMDARVQMFFKLIIFDELLIHTADEAVALLEDRFKLVESDVNHYNKKFLKDYPKAHPMTFHWGLHHWREIKHYSHEVRFICGDTPYVFFVGEAGGIEVHRIEQGKHPLIYPLYYKRKKDTNGIVFSRPGATLYDAWGRPLPETKEYFSTYKKIT